MTPGILLALAGYIILAWPDVVVFALGPFGVLLMISRPESGRERWWLIMVAAWAGLWLIQPGGVATQVIRAGGVLVTGAFVVRVLWRPDRLMRNIAAALTAGAVGTVWWSWILGLSWEEIQFSLSRATWEAYRIMKQGMLAIDGASTSEEAARGIELALQFFPALTALAAIVGLLLGWSMYQRVATEPMGAPAGPFREFRGGDHLVWGLILPLGLLISPAGPVWDSWAVNVLLVFAVLYTARGAAVLMWFLQGSGPLVVVALTVAAVLLLPIAGSGLVLLGIADTWIDFRRRMAPSGRERGKLR